MGDDARGGLHEYASGDGVAEDFAEGSFGDSRGAGDVGEGGLAVGGDGLGEVEVGDCVEALELGGTVAHYVLARAEH